MNIAVKVVHALETGSKDVLHVFTDVVDVGEKVIKVIEEVETLTPEFKSDLSVLVSDIKPIAVALAPAVAGGGENVTIDVTALISVAPAVVKLVKDFLSFIPALEAAVSALEKDATA